MGAALAAVLGYAIWAKAAPSWVYFLFGPVGLFAAVYFALPRYDHVRRIAAGAIAAVCLSLVAYLGVLRGDTGTDIAISPRMAAQARVGGCADTALASSGYYEPSLVFLTRTDIAMLDGKRAAAFMQDGPCRLAFVEARQEAAFKTALGDTPGVRLRERITGMNINGGRKLDFGVWVRAGGTP